MIMKRLCRNLGLMSALLASGSGVMHAQAPAALTIERIAGQRAMDKVLQQDVTWSPDGKTLAFVRTIAPAGKARTRTGAAVVTEADSPAAEIWGVDAATGQQKLLVSAAEWMAATGSERPKGLLDEESEESIRNRQLRSYLWAPKGDALLLGTGKSLAWFKLDTHSARSLVAGQGGLSDPRISPDGRWVSFVQDHALRLADATNGKIRVIASPGNGDQLEGEPDWSYMHELGLHSAYWWSPDSASIAWLETDDHAVDKYSLRNASGEERLIAYPKPGGSIPVVRLFVRALAGGKPVQIDLGSNQNIYVPRVQWLSDGKHLAIERLDRNQKSLDLILADVANGSAHTILTEKDTYWININDGLHFLKDSHRFLWASERSGYRHLYLYDVSGHELAQLTHGDWEVTSLAGVNESADSVYFTATEASPLQRQLYRVKLDGSGFAQVSQSKGTHAVQLSPSGDVFLDSWSNITTPPRRLLLRLDGSSIGGIDEAAPANAISQLLSPPEFITMKTHMGANLDAWIIKPPDFDPKRTYPAIFYAAGGPGEQTVRDAWGGDISLWFALMAQKGYVVFALNNRGSAGYGHFFEEPLHLRLSASEMADLRDGVMYLHSQPWVDKARVGICGWGYGGFLAIHGMLDRPLLFKAGFAGSPITDWSLYDAVFGERYLEDPVRNQDGWLSSSAVENAKYLKGPLLLAQATLDEKIHTENSLVLLDELLDKGSYADILLFADRSDLFEDRNSRKILFQRLTDFFLKNL